MAEAEAEVQEEAAEEEIPLGFKALPVMYGHEGSALAVSFAPDSRHIASGGEDQTVRLWDAILLAEVRRLRGHEASVVSTGFSKDSTRIFSGDAEGVFRVWDRESGEALHSARIHAQDLAAIAVNPDGDRIVTCSHDGTLCFLDAETFAERARAEIGTPLTSLAFHPGGKVLMVGCADSLVRRLDPETGEEAEKALKGTHGNWVISVAFSHDGRDFASACLDTSVCYWDLKKGKETRVLRSSRKWVKYVGFSGDGRYLFTTGRDGVLRVWPVGEKEELEELEGPGKGFHAGAASRDGRRFVAACVDGSLVNWAFRGMEAADLGEGGPVVVEEEDEEPKGPNPAYYVDGKFDYKKWKADNAFRFED